MSDSHAAKVPKPAVFDLMRSVWMRVDEMGGGKETPLNVILSKQSFIIDQ